MNRNLIWGWLLLAGMLVTRLGYGVVNDDQLPDLMVTLLLTTGLLACLAGVAGLLGALNWLRPASLQHD
ncbi:hypothetical protein [Rugamonas sp.]|uniref:hypothetical protein n=1 Tax=Rugamonas sp. TaxID=1926287 RepID=UPI0025E891FC|nr:hypothetical protein [Rugamonas sp.]